MNILLFSMPDSFEPCALRGVGPGHSLRPMLSTEVGASCSGTLWRVDDGQELGRAELRWQIPCALHPD